jgi:hypothetical protein
MDTPRCPSRVPDQKTFSNPPLRGNDPVLGYKRTFLRNSRRHWFAALLQTTGLLTGGERGSLLAPPRDYQQQANLFSRLLLLLCRFLF